MVPLLTLAVTWAVPIPALSLLQPGSQSSTVGPALGRMAGPQVGRGEVCWGLCPSGGHYFRR